MSKIKIGIFLFFAIEIFCFANSSNLVINSSAEKDKDKNFIPDGWEKRGETAFWAKGIYYTGENSFGIIENGDEYWAGWVSVIDKIEEGAVYFIKAMVKCENIENYAQIWVYWIDEKNQHIGKENPVGDKITGTNDWKEKVSVLVAPSGAKKLKILLTSYQKKNSNGRVFFDDIEVMKILEPPMGLIEKGKNILYNGDFEMEDPLIKNVPFGWRPEKPEISRSSIVWEKIGYKGRCVSLENFEDSDLCFLYSIPYDFKPNSFYLVKFYYRFNKKEGRSLYIFYPDDVKEIPDKDIRSDLPIEWNFYSFLFKTPGEIKKPYICFSLYQNRGGLKVWIDEIELIEIKTYE